MSRLTVIASAIVLCLFSSTLAQDKGPGFAGVFSGDKVTLTLAAHPHWPEIEFVGVLVSGPDQKVQAMKLRNDPVKGCHGVIYDGSIANQQAVELKVTGDKLTMRYYNGPTIELKREAKP